MGFAAILILSIGLAMDASAVSAAGGCVARRVRVRDVFAVAGLFGLFQAGMPLLGWWLGEAIGPLVFAWDHWIAFGLLGLIGGKMLFDALRPKAADSPDGDCEDTTSDTDPFRMRLLLPLAVATSIDAFSVGVVLPMMEAPMLVSLVTIGVTTALLSAAALYVGRALGAAIGRRFELLGGVVLIGIGTKILVEHLGLMGG